MKNANTIAAWQRRQIPVTPDGAFTILSVTPGVAQLLAPSTNVEFVFNNLVTDSFQLPIPTSSADAPPAGFWANPSNDNVTWRFVQVGDFELDVNFDFAGIVDSVGTVISGTTSYTFTILTDVS